MKEMITWGLKGLYKNANTNFDLSTSFDKKSSESQKKKSTFTV